MEFSVFRDLLTDNGYTDDTAYAKIAHDIVLKAVQDSGFHDNLTVKGGVVMSSLTDLARRATMDMDVDFMRYPLSNEAIRRFVSGLNRVAPCRIRISGKIETLNQQEYKGKRIHLILTDEKGLSIVTKIDIGVHTRIDVEQADFSFKVVTGESSVVLLVNQTEQIFVEKLKSLLRFGSASTRFKDIFDMFYLLEHVRKAVILRFLGVYVFDDETMREKDIADIVNRITRVFSNKKFISNLSKPVNAWLDVSPKMATEAITSFLSSLGSH